MQDGSEGQVDAAGFPNTVVTREYGTGAETDKVVFSIGGSPQRPFYTEKGNQLVAIWRGLFCADDVTHRLRTVARDKPLNESKQC